MSDKEPQSSQMTVVMLAVEALAVLALKKHGRKLTPQEYLDAQDTLVAALSALNDEKENY